MGERAVKWVGLCEPANKVMSGDANEFAAKRSQLEVDGMTYQNKDPHSMLSLAYTFVYCNELVMPES